MECIKALFGAPFFVETTMHVALQALDVLGLALASHNHLWSPVERDLYERAVAELGGEPRPLIPSDCFWITDENKLRVARKVSEQDGAWTLVVFRNPDDAYAGNAMKTAPYTPL